MNSKESQKGPGRGQVGLGSQGGNPRVEEGIKKTSNKPTEWEEEANSIRNPPSGEVDDLIPDIEDEVSAAGEYGGEGAAVDP